MPSPAQRTADATSWQRRWLGSHDYWFFQILTWGLFCAIWISTSLMLAPSQRDAAYETRQIVRNLMNGVACIGLTHLLHILLGILGAHFKSWRFILCIALAVPFFSTALITLGAGIVLLTPPYAPGSFIMRWTQAFTAIFMWTGFYFAFDNRRKYQRELLTRARLDVALKDAELRALKSQINPHFLFNSLNSLRAQIPLELERPRETVTRLAELLRAALGSSEYTTIPLSQELGNVENYLALEKIRYQTRLRVEQNITPESREWPVPPFLLQSLVENAVNHGIAQRDEGGTVALKTRIVNETLHVTVSNPGHIEPNRHSTKVGLKNSQSRLNLIFGDKASLSLTQTNENQVVAELLIPQTTISP